MNLALVFALAALAASGASAAPPSPSKPASKPAARPASAKPGDEKPASAEAAPAAPAKPAAPPASAPSAVAGMEPVPGNSNLWGNFALQPGVLHEAQRFDSWRSATVFDVSSDGSQVLIGTRFASTVQLHLLDQPLGARTQQTFGDEPVSGARFLPQDPGVVFFLQDAGGGELYQINRLDRRTQKQELITDGKSRNEALLLSHDGRKLAFGTTARNGKDIDVVVADTESPLLQKRLTELEGSWLPLDFSPGARQLLVEHERSIADVELWLITLENGEKKQLTGGKGAQSLRAAAFTPDGHGVYLVTDKYSDFNELYRLDLARPEADPQPLTRGLNWNVEELAVSSDPGAPVQVALVANQDGYGRLYLLEPGTAHLTAMALPVGLVGNVRFAERKSDLLTLSLQTPTSPGDVWQLDVRSHKLTRWTRSELGPLDPSRLVEPKLVRYPTSDGTQVPAFLYRAAGAEGEAAAKLPTVVIWHGGPEGQSRPSFNPLAQMLVAEGFAVVLPNVRGSDGYGKAYLAADDGVKREQSLADLGATFDWIAAQPDLDGNRIGVYGGSYGGYLALASAAFFPKRVRACVDVVGISSLPSFLHNTSAYRRDLRRAEYGDERIPAVLAVQERISPLGSAAKIEASLLVIQGKNDPRVPQSESEQLVSALRARGRAVWYLLGLNEGHGFQKKDNKDAASAAALQFLRAHLQSVPAPATTAK